MHTIHIPSEWFEYKSGAIDIFGRPTATPALAMRIKAQANINALQRQLTTMRDPIRRNALIQSIREAEYIIFWLNGIAESVIY
jgi:hypothetical protein